MEPILTRQLRGVMNRADAAGATDDAVLAAEIMRLAAEIAVLRHDLPGVVTYDGHGNVSEVRPERELRGFIEFDADDRVNITTT